MMATINRSAISRVLENPGGDVLVGGERGRKSRIMGGGGRRGLLGQDRRLKGGPKKGGIGIIFDILRRQRPQNSEDKGQ